MLLLVTIPRIVELLTKVECTKKKTKSLNPFTSHPPSTNSHLELDENNSKCCFAWAPALKLKNELKTKRKKELINPLAVMSRARCNKIRRINTCVDVYTDKTLFRTNRRVNIDGVTCTTSLTTVASSKLTRFQTEWSETGLRTSERHASRDTTLPCLHNVE